MADSTDEHVARTILEEVRELRKEAAGERAASVREWLNSPLAVTVLGGLVATGLTVLWQYAEGERDHARTVQSESIARKHALIADFPRRFSTSLDRLLGFKQRELWLRAHSLGDGALYPDGKSYAETRAVHEALYQEYLSSGSSDALCGQLLATFESDEARAGARELDTLMDDLMKEKDEQAMYALYDRADAQFQAMIELMGAEVHAPRSVP